MKQATQALLAHVTPPFWRQGQNGTIRNKSKASTRNFGSSASHTKPLHTECKGVRHRYLLEGGKAGVLVFYIVIGCPRVHDACV